MEISYRLIVHTALILIALAAALAVLIAFSSAIAGQGAPQAEWGRAYDGGHYDYGSTGLQASDGGYVITGGVSPAYKGDRNILLLKADSNGSMQWQRSFGGDGFDYGYAVIEPPGGGYAVAGVTESRGNGSGDVYLIRTDAGGNPQWERTYGGSGYDQGRALLQASDGGFIVAGYTNSRGNGSGDVYLFKTDAQGELQWEKTYGGPYDDLAITITKTRDGGYVVGGRYGTAGDSGEAYLLKVDASGNVQWDKRTGEPDSIIYQARQTEDRGYVAVGYTGYQSGNGSILLYKVDGQGNILWHKTITAPNRTLKGYDIFLAPDGGYIIVGESGSEAGKNEGLLVKTDNEGNLEWQQPYGAERDVFIRSGIPTRDHGLALVGSIGDKGDVETWDVYLLKLSSI
ncbi:MAG: hypothetical protein WBZ29_00375 [Methanocella sp.]